MARAIATAIGGAALAVLANAAVEAQSGADVAAACGAGTNLPEAVCACIGDKAEADLSDIQRQWYILAVGGQSDAAAALLPQMSAQEAIDAGTFVRTSPVDCARGN